MDDITFIKVDMEICFETCPCQHYVTTNNDTRLMCGRDIAYLQKKIYNNVDEHFICYLKK